MLTPLIDLSPLATPLAQGDLILTANNRLRNHLLRAYAAEQTQPVWQPPAIQPLNHWLTECWRKLQDLALPQAATLIASAAQRQLVWEEIILTSDSGSALLQAEELAQTADTALRHLQLWELSAEQINAENNVNSQTFLSWLVRFEQALETRGLVTQETAYEIVLQAFVDKQLSGYPRLYLQGFDDLPPLYRRLLTCACKELIELPHSKLANSQLVRTQAVNTDAEIRAAACWSQAQLQQDATAVIGIIVPNLGQSRAQVERIFTEVFEAHAGLPQTPRYTLPFNFSAGTPLASTPLIQAALNLLNLNRKQWELEPLCTLLQSPFFGAAESELVVRSALCDRLRNLGQFTISASELRYHSDKVCRHFNHLDSDNLAARLIALEQDRRTANGRHSASVWVQLFQRQLQQLGWPGERRLDSQEFQQMNLWHRLLENFCALDGGNFSFDLTQVLKHLRNLANSTPFQAQTPDSPIQILGILEGAGLQFSHCWVMGLHHREWPPAPAPNPLLPINLQRLHNMPHASAERELVFAQALTENYRHCAKRIVFSSPHGDGDNELRPSALIRDLPLTPLIELVPQTLSAIQIYTQTLTQTRRLELVDCANGPTLDTQTQLRGGSSLFKLQAACPFNAFAQLRLGARNINPPALGFNAMQRGTLLHDALAFAWRQLGNSTKLHACSDEELTDILVEAIATAIQPLQQQRPRELGKVYCALEQERLLQLLLTWLTDEKTRPAFTPVALEEAFEIQFCGLTFNTRIDRIDELDGSPSSHSDAIKERILIDYKTGSPKISAWDGTRPDDPQLPLYAITMPDAVAAITFAQINAKAMGWKGLGELSVQHPGINTGSISWSEQLHMWRAVLTQLAEDFIAGDARVDFKDTQAMQYTGDLIPLNRSAEADIMANLLTYPLSTQQLLAKGITDV